MNILKYLFPVSVLFLSACMRHIDAGGRVWDYHKAAVESRRTEAKVIIDYECNSACIIKLSSGPGLCVSRDAKFGVHEPRFAPWNLDYSRGIRVEKLVNATKKLIPACAVKLFDSKHAFDSPNLTYFTGKEVLQSCPEIKECPDDV